MAARKPKASPVAAVKDDSVIRYTPEGPMVVTHERIQDGTDISVQEVLTPITE